VGESSLRSSMSVKREERGMVGVGEVS
jgi:hypothetical protein